MGETETRRGDTDATVRSTLAGGRHGLVDALRGFALLGIVVVNVEFIVQHADVGWHEHTDVLDIVTRFLVTTFGELKIYPLFALLFGYGLAVQLRRAAQTEGTLGRRYGRRMVGLIFLGAAHAVLFFPGDILVIYAVVGSLAFLLRRRTSAQLTRLAVMVYAAASATWFVVAMAFLLVGADIEAPPPTGSLQVLTSGSFVDVIGQHFSVWPGSLFVLALVQGPAAFAFVLAGIALGRTDVLTNPAAHRGIARRVVTIAGPVGLVGGGVGAALAIHGGRFGVLGLAIGFLVAPMLSCAYVAAAVLAWGHAPRVFRVLQAPGRMSLSVYLLESVALSTLAYGYGVGVIGSLAPRQGVVLAVGVWAGLCLFAIGWLRFARFGPAEWALRSFSYWRLQPLRASRPSGPSS